MSGSTIDQMIFKLTWKRSFLSCAPLWDIFNKLFSLQELFPVFPETDRLYEGAYRWNQTKNGINRSHFQKLISNGLLKVFSCFIQTKNWIQKEISSINSSLFFFPVFPETERLNDHWNRSKNWIGLRNELNKVFFCWKQTKNWIQKEFLIILQLSFLSSGALPSLPWNR